MSSLLAGQIRLRGVSRKFKVVHDRSLTLKETLIRRRRVVATDLWALREIDLDITPGQAVGIVGRNGTGKSTLLKLIAEIIPPNSGTIEVGGSVASLLELGAGFHPDFTGRENVYLNAAIYGLGERAVDARMDQIIDFAEIREFADMPVRTYSSGMYMRLAFSIASHVNPDILLLDEVLAVGDEAFQRKCFGRIFEFRRGGGTLVLVSHDPGAVQRVCDRVIYLDNGNVVFDGLPEEGLARYHEDLSEGGGQPQSSVPAIPAPGDSVGESYASYGSGKVTITGVRLKNESGDITDRFLEGAHLVVEIDYEFVDAAAVDPKFSIRVADLAGSLLFEADTANDGISSRPSRPTGTITLRCSALPLREGRFAVSIGADSWNDSEVYHHLDHCSEFSVFPASLGQGMLTIAHDWTLESRGGATMEAKTAG